MVIGIILIVLVIAFIVSRAFRNTPEHKGREGELHVHNILAQLPEDYTILDDVMLKTGNVTTQHHVVYDDQLLATIRSYSYPCLSDADVAQVVNRLTQQNVRDQVDDRTHVSNVYAAKYKTDSKIASGICPQCGGTLVLRHGKYGNFYGCSNYPRCRFTTH